MGGGLVWSVNLYKYRQKVGGRREREDQETQLFFFNIFAAIINLSLSIIIKIVINYEGIIPIPVQDE